MDEQLKQYSEKDLAEFKEIIEAKIKQAQRDLSLLESAYKNDSDNSTNDTAPTFKSFDEICFNKELSLNSLMLYIYFYEMSLVGYQDI